MLLLFVKVRRNDRKLFQRDASDSDTGLHRATVLSMFPGYYGTKRNI